MVSVPPTSDPAAPVGEPYDIYGGVKPDSDLALARFDDAFDGFEPDQALLAGTPARTLAEAMGELVASLKRIDIDRVAKRQSWWDRFTGADLEARLELEVAAKFLGEDMARVSAAAVKARYARAALRGDLPRLDAAQQTHQDLADATAAFLRGADPSHPVIVRLQRRLGNLEALLASNRLTRAQMELAGEHLDGLLDRFADIEQLLFPVWQRHALAVAQSAAPADEGGTLTMLKSIHARLESALTAQRTSAV